MSSVGNLAGGALRRSVETCERGLRITAFYTSNIEFYLMREGGAAGFMANLARLPRQPGSLIVRSVFPGGGARVSSGYNSASVTQPIQALLDGYHEGRFRQYWELVR